jgi:hypothetical protein
LAKEKKCDFIKLDTLSFKAIDFYKKRGFEVFGTIHNEKIVREEQHGCITDLHNNNYTGIELILLKGAVPNRKYAIGLL